MRLLAMRLRSNLQVRRASTSSTLLLPPFLKAVPPPAAVVDAVVDTSTKHGDIVLSGTLFIFIIKMKLLDVDWNRLYTKEKKVSKRKLDEEVKGDTRKEERGKVSRGEDEIEAFVEPDDSVMEAAPQSSSIIPAAAGVVAVAAAGSGSGVQLFRLVGLSFLRFISHSLSYL